MSGSGREPPRIELKQGDAVKLIKYPPNRYMMDWDRILHIGQIGHITYINHDSKEPLYAVWFTAKNRRESWEVWLSNEHFTVA